MKDITDDLDKLERDFQELIIRQCTFCGFDKFLEENPDFEFPKITEELLGWENGRHITIPGLFGGFDYFLEKVGGVSVLYAEQSSRMDYDSDAYSYCEITANGSRLLEGEEREIAREKFWKLAKKAHEERLQKLRKMQKETEK